MSFVNDPPTISGTFSRFSDNFEEKVLELTENIEEIISQYYMHDDIFIRFKS